MTQEQAEQWAERLRSIASDMARRGRPGLSLSDCIDGWHSRVLAIADELDPTGPQFEMPDEPGYGGGGGGVDPS